MNKKKNVGIYQELNAIPLMNNLENHGLIFGQSPSHCIDRNRIPRQLKNYRPNANRRPKKIETMKSLLSLILVRTKKKKVSSIADLMTHIHNYRDKHTPRNRVNETCQLNTVSNRNSSVYRILKTRYRKLTSVEVRQNTSI